MQQSFKKLKPLRWLAAIVFASTLFVACESKESKTTESTESTEAVKDSMPPLDTDTLNNTRPETIKNTSGTTQQQQ